MPKSKELAKKILMMLESQDFADFYTEGDLDNYIRVDYPEGHPKHITKEMILEKVEKFVRKYKLHE